MTVEQFEKQVWEVERVRLVIRAPAAATVKSYGHKNAATKTWSVSEWKKKRIKAKIGNLGAVVIDGRGRIPHGRTLLSSVRAGYR